MATRDKELALEAEIEQLKKDLERSKENNHRLQAEMNQLREDMSQLERCAPAKVRASETYKMLLEESEKHKNQAGLYRRLYASLYDENKELKRTIDELNEEIEQLKNGIPSSGREQKNRSSKSKKSPGRKPKIPKELRDAILKAHENKVATIRELVKIINNAENRNRLKDLDDCPEEILDVIDIMERDGIDIHVTKSTIHRELERKKRNRINDI